MWRGLLIRSHYLLITFVPLLRQETILELVTPFRAEKTSNADDARIQHSAHRRPWSFVSKKKKKDHLSKTVWL